MSHLITDIWNSQAGSYAFFALKYRDGRWKDYAIKRAEFKNAEAWVAAHRSENVYWCPHVFHSPRRREEFAMPSQYAGIDLDEVDPRALRYRPTIAIQTSPKRFQGLWKFDRPLLKSLRKGLNDFCKGDSGGWMLTKVLRVPGTKNYKYDPPASVKLLWRDGPLYRANDIMKLAVDVPDVDDEGDARRPRGDALKIINKYLEKSRLPGLNATLLSTCEPPRNGRPGHRSSVVHKIGLLLVEAGATREEIGCVMFASESFKSKWGKDLKRLWREADAAIAKGKR